MVNSNNCSSDSDSVMTAPSTVNTIQNRTYVNNTAHYVCSKNNNIRNNIV